MTKKQKSERKLGNALRAARGHFKIEGGKFISTNTQTSRGIELRLIRAFDRTNRTA